MLGRAPAAGFPLFLGKPLHQFFRDGRDEPGGQVILRPSEDHTLPGVGDVQFLKNEEQLTEAIHKLPEKGIKDFVVSAHVKGDLIKFYGVRHTPFFQYGYPTDLGQTKFGLEQYNGIAHHYAFSVDQLRSDANRLAEELGVDVYGGDCIVREDGSYCLIDFNDWPSFSWCREEAARAIAELVKQKWT